MLDDTEQLGQPMRPAVELKQQKPPDAPQSPAVAASDADRRETKAAPPRNRTRLRVMAAIGLALLLGVGGYFGHYWWTAGRFMVSTDDAYVGVKSATLSPKVSGYLAQVAVEDNAHLKAGDVIARIEDGDYRLAVQTARDQIAVQRAAIERLSKQAVAQEAAVDQAKAQVASAKAGATRADLELKRQKDLATRQVNSRAALEQAQASYDQAVAAVQAGEAAVEAATANVAVLHAQREEALRTLQQNQTALAKAERDLSFTVIRAPFDGVIGNRAMQVGDYVQPTQRLASLVPLDAVYIDANFKETQLSRLKPGQPVSITVDALPGRTIEGQVASLAPASGSVFSLLPPDNATGNFTKIVQRLPVRILVPAAVAGQDVLRPGMSVIVKVNTKPGAPAPSQQMNTAALRTR
ncbi:MAG TPA: HlyD family secretion protein [Hyphomicrobiaceae bacterium]|nr:HlyD family secretion protein [Hyphomicrobiaceae bacterium]